MTEIKIDINFDNCCDENFTEIRNIDEKELKTNSAKICKFFLNNKPILEQSTLFGFDFSKLSFELILINDSEIHQINLQYRQKNSPTDVITFALFADSEPKFVLDGEISLGEIIISPETVFRQSKENGNSFEKELYYIISHGILHLLGFDHLTEFDYKFMVDWQNKAIKELYV